MKKAVHIFIVLLLLVSTAGVTVDSHYCGSSFMGTTIMGSLLHHGGESANMPCCSNNKHCKHCKTFSRSYRIQSSFLLERILHLHQPILADNNWSDLYLLYTNLFVNIPTIIFTENSNNCISFYEREWTSARGFRAPPSNHVYC